MAGVRYSNIEPLLGVNSYIWPFPSVAPQSLVHWAPFLFKDYIMSICFINNTKHRLIANQGYATSIFPVFSSIILVTVCLEISLLEYVSKSMQKMHYVNCTLYHHSAHSSLFQIRSLSTIVALLYAILIVLLSFDRLNQNISRDWI